MCFLRTQGFKDGLALGLARFGLVNNNNTSQNNNVNNNDTVITTTTTTTIPQSITLPPTTNITSVPVSNTVKQKSLLRKNRQTPAPFELNVSTPIDSSQARLAAQQFSEDLSKAFANTTITATDKNNVKKPNFLEDFKLVSLKLTFPSINGCVNASYMLVFSYSKSRHFKLSRILKMPHQRLYQQVTLWIRIHQ